MFAQLIEQEHTAAEIMFIIAFFMSVMAVGFAISRRMYVEAYVALVLSALSLGWIFL